MSRAWLETSKRMLQQVARDPSMRSATFSFLLTRIFVFVIFIFVTHVSVVIPDKVFGRDPQDVRIQLYTSGIAQELRPLAERAGAWYLDVAVNGHEHKPFTAVHQHNWAFLPLFPLLWWLAAKITGGYLLTGIAIANLFFFLALLLLHKTALAFGYDEGVADRMVFYMAVFPMSYFFSMPVSEPLFLLLSVASFLAAKRGMWWLAGLMGALAAATRVTGVLLLPALLILYWQQSGRFKFDLKMLFLLLIPAGLLTFMIYLHFITGNAGAFADIQRTWGRNPGFFIQPLWNYITSPLIVSDRWDFRLLNFVCAVLTFACGFVLVKWREWALAFYTFASIIVPLSSLELQSLGRYTMVVFPVFLVLAMAGRRLRIDQTIRAIFVGLLGIMSALFSALVTLALS